MNYTSPTFWILFGAVILAYWRLGHRGQNTFLLIASYIFYGFWDYRFLFLILISTAIDFVGGLGVAGVQLPARKLWNLALLVTLSALLLCSGVRYDVLWRGILDGDVATIGSAISKDVRDYAVPIGTALSCLAYGAMLPWLYNAPEQKRRTLFLTISMVANLGILGFFKYHDFFVANLQALLTRLGVGPLPWEVLGVVLPAGISFYTFQAMSYTIDIYREEVEPTTSLPDFALFICFFPHLVAGPIMRAHTLLPQVVNPRWLKPGDVEEGFWLVSLGMFKKMIIADNAATLANALFNPFAGGSAPGVTGPETLIGVYAFAIQIYADFSGYSNIARGISKWLGYELVVNFHLPYLAVSPSDFWRRWHISLSTWLRDYLYIPLGGNRSGVSGTYRNLMITMLLGGLWHGASWTFVAWGLFHGLILCLFRALGVSDRIDRSTLAGKLHWLARVALMFHLTCLGWILFRAESMSAGLEMLGRMATSYSWTAFATSAAVWLAFLTAPFLLFEVAIDGESSLGRVMGLSWWKKAAVLSYLSVMILLFRPEGNHEFIYFQF